MASLAEALEGAKTIESMRRVARAAMDAGELVCGYYSPQPLEGEVQRECDSRAKTREGSVLEGMIWDINPHIRPVPIPADQIGQPAPPPLTPGQQRARIEELGMGRRHPAPDQAPGPGTFVLTKDLRDRCVTYRELEEALKARYPNGIPTLPGSASPPSSKRE